MARRTVTGQLNMFDFFSSMEGEAGEVEMVSLMPNFEDEPKVKKESKVEDEPEVKVELEIETEPEVLIKSQIEKTENKEQVAMSRTYEVDGETLEIAYINYNKVRITRGKNESEMHVFETSKEAVDYYVERMQELESDEENR